ncbi:MAG: GTP-binding protein [Candidatus Lokiarchaeota archaeon]|nr:GTP-binding protein [Candidatus Lokiarchaeota archaeon]
MLRRKFLFKICVVGDGGVGKSTMVKRLITGKYIEQKITIGADLSTYYTNIDDDEIILQLWDFAGERRFQFFLPNYSRGVKGCLLCYDVGRRASFERLYRWYDIIDKTNNPIFVLVGCKNDLGEEKKVITQKDAEIFQNENSINMFIETSSKTGHNIKDLFTHLAIKIYHQEKEKI